MTTITESSIFHLLASEEAYPIDFDLAWQWIGYATKQKAEEALLANLEKDTDFLTLGLKSSKGGRPAKDIRLTLDGFKMFCMMAGTPKGREVRKYFLDCEKKYKEQTAQPQHAIPPGWHERMIQYEMQCKVPKGYFTIFAEI